MSKVVLIQRFYANFREGLFDKFNDELNFNLISHHKGFGKIKEPQNLNRKRYFKNIFSFRVYKDYIWFPFLFFYLWWLNPAIVVTEGGKNTINNIQVLFYCFVFNKPYIIWDLGKGYQKEVKAPLHKIPYTLIQDQLYKRSKKIFTYNKQGFNYFITRYPNKEVVVLQNTVDTNRINKILLSEPNFPSDVPKSFLNKRLIIGYIGAISETKKTAKLEILKDLDDVALIVIGDGRTAYVEHVKKKFKDIESVFVGYKSLEQLNAYYNIIDLIVMPGLGGLTIPQSFAFKTSVVALKADGTEKEIIEPNKNGYILNTIEELPDLLNKHNKEEFKSMGIYGKVKVDAKFSIDNYCNRFKASL